MRCPRRNNTQIRHLSQEPIDAPAIIGPAARLRRIEIDVSQMRKATEQGVLPRVVEWSHLRSSAGVVLSPDLRLDLLPSSTPGESSASTRDATAPPPGPVVVGLRRDSCREAGVRCTWVAGEIMREIGIEGADSDGSETVFLQLHCRDCVLDAVCL